MIWWCRQENKPCSMANENGYCQITACCNTSMPTVKAIPLDKPFCKMIYGDYVCYNREWLMKHLPMELDILQGKEYQPAITIEWMKSWAMKNWVKTGKCEFDIIVSKMIEDWEKENGIDKDMPHELLSEREKRALQETVDWVRSWLGDDAVVGISYTKEDWEKENES